MLKISRPARSLLLLGFISCLVLFTLTSRFDLLDGQTSRRHLQSRQIIIGPDEKTTSAATSATATATQPTATSQQAPTSTQQTSPTQSQPTPTSANPPTSTSTSESTSATTSSTSSLPAETSSAPPPTSAPPAQTSAQPTPTPVPSTSASLSTGANGEVETIIVTTLVTPSSTSSSVAPSQTSNEDNDNTGSKGVGTSTIVGLSVAGGIALIVVVGFVVWKFTRKRANDDFDDNEAIKWPELNTHGDNAAHALPTNRTGGAGFETNSEVNLTRPDSRAGSIAPSAAASAVDLYVPGQDPYAVPPLPHLNPNQPYRDDPGAGYYDPYSGPVPNTLGNSEGEAFAMTQINRTRSPAPQMAFDPVTGGTRARSPGPQAAYDMSMAGRVASPGPQMAYGGYGDRARSPGPGMAMGGRSSPGPQMALGYGGNGRQSPGPGMAYGS